jgi:hypothetical protein
MFCLLLVAATAACPLHAQQPRSQSGLSESAKAQIRALIAEKMSRTPSQLKLDSQLVFAIRSARHDPLMAALPALKPALELQAGNRVKVDIKATVTDQLLTKIRRLGGPVLFSDRGYHTIQTQLTLSSLESLAADPSVVWIRPASKLICYTDSEGDTTMLAMNLRQATSLSPLTLGLTGQGITVGVISDSADYLSTLQKQGLLPNDVTVLPGQFGKGEGEGTAMMEIVHDLAPAAKLCFATAGINPAQTALNVLKLAITAHCNIIVDDIGWPSESPFQDDEVAQAVDIVTQNGALYFSSARNDGNQDASTSETWEGDYVDSGYSATYTSGAVSRTEEFLSFSSAGTNPHTNRVKRCNEVSLFWSDPLGDSTNDYDVFVLDSTGKKVLGASTNPQSGNGDDPVELIENGFPNGSLILVGLYSGQGRFIHLEGGINNHTTLQYATQGSTRGHNAAANAFSIGAVSALQSYPNSFSSSNTIETFSSDGPRHIFYDSGGNAITPGNVSSSGGAILQKPDFAAADGVSTDVPNSNFQPFFGTSAAAPHAAAVAALLLSYDPQLSASDLRQIFSDSAWKIMSDGNDWNRNAGFGLIDALQAGITLASQSVVSFTIAPTGVMGGASATGTIQVNIAAPPAGLVFNLSSNNSAVTVPATVTLSGGQTTATFPITTAAVAQATSATITAALFNYAYFSANLTVGTPTAPTGLYAGASDQSVTLRWTPVQGATHYHLYSATKPGGEGQQIYADIYTQQGYFQAGGLSNGTTYYFQLTALNAAGESPRSVEVSATPGSTPLPAPTLTGSVGNQTCMLTWTAVAQAKSYILFRVVDEVGASGTYTTGIKATHFTDTNVQNGVTYRYIVCPVGINGTGIASNEVDLTP